MKLNLFSQKIFLLYVLLFVLVFLSLFQIYRIFQFIKKSSKQNQELQKLLDVFPTKDYKRVFADAHSLIEDIPEIQNEQQKVFSYPCSFLDKYGFHYTFGVWVYPALENSTGFFITCKENKELFQKLQKQGFSLIRSSEFFYLWKNL